MINVMCEKCTRSWFVLDDIWSEVKYCPFCGEKLKISYEMKEDSFEALLKYVFLCHGLDILKAKKKMVSLLMDVGNKYGQEIRIFSNFCSEEILFKFYNAKEDALLLDKASEIAKIEMLDNGISERWVDVIIDNLIKAVKSIYQSDLGMPSNFHIVDEKIGISDEKSSNRTVESSKDSWEIVTTNMFDAEQLCKEIFLYGIDLLKRDKGRAIECIKFAAKHGIIEANVLLGNYYENGNGVIKDIDIAREYYRQAAVMGNHEAEYKLGIILYKDRQEEGMVWIKKAANAGYSEAVKYIINMKNIENTNIIVKSVINSTELKEEYAESLMKRNKRPTEEEIKEIFCLGRKLLKEAEKKCSSYDAKEVKERFFRKPIEYIRYAANYGLKDADFLLGYCYENGVGVDKNKITAEGYYRMGMISGKLNTPKFDMEEAASYGRKIYIRNKI